MRSVGGPPGCPDCHGGTANGLPAPGAPPNGSGVARAPITGGGLAGWVGKIDAAGSTGCATGLIVTGPSTVVGASAASAASAASPPSGGSAIGVNGPISVAGEPAPGPASAAGEAAPGPTSVGSEVACAPG